MVALSISMETATDLTWSAWKRLILEVEQLGFAGLFRSDHLANPDPPDAYTIDMIVALTYLADNTERIHFGSLVAPLSFRDPVILTHQAAALDALCQGRMILGLGAVGTPDEFIERLQAYTDVGVQEVMLQWWEANDLEGLRMFAEEIMPYV